ncbi:MAG: hypothetical protein IH991_25105 [Planctomycetes bacterium]|nr:hypothetical protein [Planctomycetota bacterium]
MATSFGQVLGAHVSTFALVTNTLVKDQEVGSKSVRLTSALGAREVRFEHVFDGLRVESGKPAAVPMTASITGDRLSLDDERHLVVHVVSELPVVFVDQFGPDEEDSRKNRRGETKSLRKLLAPRLSGEDRSRQLVKIRHRKIGQLTLKDLEDARLVVIAGVNSPSPDVVIMLREFVTQGGQLLIAAGADFDPQRWNDVAWLDGAGILPAPLFPEPIGQLPEEATGELKPVFLSFESLGSHYYFQLADTPEEELRALYSPPLMFFKYVEMNVSDEVKQKLKEFEVERLTKAREFLDEIERRKKEQNAKGNGAANTKNSALVNDDEQRLREIRPTWLRWKSDSAGPLDEVLPEDANERKKRIEELAEEGLPRVLARLTDDKGSAYLVERRIGKGNVLFSSSGLQSSWCTLHTTDAILMYDRMLRSMIQSTLPQLNFVPKERIDLPAPADQNVTVALRRPGTERLERLRIDFVSGDRLGLMINNPLIRGIYTVEAYRPEVNLEELAGEKPLWQMPLSVNGDPAESELASLGRSTFEKRSGQVTNVRWVGPTEEISVEGTQVRNQDMWIFFILAVLLFLLTELALLALPALRRAGAPSTNVDV